MGIRFGLPGKIGLPTLDSLSIDQLYNNYFSEVGTAEEFQCAVIKLCSDFNTIMPGKHYIIDQVEVKEFYKRWNDKAKDTKAGKEELVKFMVDHIEDYKPSSFAMICTGCVAPAGAIALKKTGEKIPQLKRFRIDIIPNFVVVPTVTLISLIGVRIFSLKKGLKPSK